MFYRSIISCKSYLSLREYIKLQYPSASLMYNPNVIEPSSVKWGLNESCKMYRFRSACAIRAGCSGPKLFASAFHRTSFLSHNNPCFRCNIAIKNFLVSNTCEIRIHDVIDRTVHMGKWVCFGHIR